MHAAPDIDALLSDTLAVTLADVMAAVPALDRERGAAIAHAVAHFCAGHGRAWVGRPDVVAVLAAKSFSRLGDDEAADAILLSQPRLAPLAGVVRAEHLAPTLVSMVAAQVVRFEPGLSLGTRLTVVFDLRRVRQDAEAALELASIPSLHRLVDLCNPLWLEGDAMLGLRGLSAHRAAPTPGRRRAVRDPWVQAVQDRLAFLASQQGWRRVPPVIELD
jgi:hypothetical protein